MIREVFDHMESSGANGTLRRAVVGNQSWFGNALEDVVKLDEVKNVVYNQVYAVRRLRSLQLMETSGVDKMVPCCAAFVPELSAYTDVGKSEPRLRYVISKRKAQPQL
eukprot:1521867-Amphidinium_carterae.1